MTSSVWSFVPSLTRSPPARDSITWTLTGLGIQWQLKGPIQRGDSTVLSCPVCPEVIPCGRNKIKILASFIKDILVDNSGMEEKKGEVGNSKRTSSCGIRIKTFYTRCELITVTGWMDGWMTVVVPIKRRMLRPNWQLVIKISHLDWTIKGWCPPGKYLDEGHCSTMSLCHRYLEGFRVSLSETKFNVFPLETIFAST